MSECKICSISDENAIAITRFSKAFVSPVPVARAHLVVAPREHRLSMLDLDGTETSDLFLLCRDVTRAAADRVKVEKFYLAAVGDIDKHFHLHLLPKRVEDPGMGPFIFGEKGWAGALSEESGVEDLENSLRSHFGR